MTSPVASRYLRVPEDTRLVREFIRQNSQDKFELFYVGMANCEDFFSWYTVGFGLGKKVKWSGCDIQNVQLFRNEIGDVNFQIGHFSGMLKLDYYDIVICNYVFEPTDVNVEALIVNKPMLVICRNNFLPLEELQEKLKDYTIWEHTNQYDIDTDGCKMRNVNYLWFRKDVAIPTNKYIRLKRCLVNDQGE